MKKIIILSLMLIMASAVAGCQSEKSAPPTNPADSTDSPSPEQTAQISESPEVQQIVSHDVAPTQEALAIDEAVAIELLGMELKGVDYDAGRYSEHLFFKLRYTNHTDKSVRGFESVITFNDMFGKKILSISLDNTDTIPAMDSITTGDMYLDVNQFMADHNKLKATDYDDIIFEYALKTVLFTDGTKMPDDYPQGIFVEPAAIAEPTTGLAESDGGQGGEPWADMVPGLFYKGSSDAIMPGGSPEYVESILGSGSGSDGAYFYCDDKILVMYTDEQVRFASSSERDLRMSNGIGVGTPAKEAEKCFGEVFSNGTLVCPFDKDGNKLPSDSKSWEYIYILGSENDTISSIAIMK